MNLRNTIILLGILIALLALVYGTEPGVFGKPEPTATLPPNQAQVFKFDSTKINHLTVQDEIKQSTAEVAKENDLWQIVKPVQDEGDNQRIVRVVNQVADLRATRKLEGTLVADLASFGLASPAYNITVSLEDGGQATLRIGDKNPQSTAYYVQKDDDPAVYLVTTSTIEGMTTFISSPPIKPTPTATWTATPPATSTSVVEPLGTPSPGDTNTEKPFTTPPVSSTTQPPATLWPAVIGTAIP